MMRIQRPEWLNRERLTFLLVALWLAVVSLALTEPGVAPEPVGPQTVTDPLPAPVRVDVAEFSRPLWLDLNGQDPFNLPPKELEPVGRRPGQMPDKPIFLPPKPEDDQTVATPEPPVETGDETIVEPPPPPPEPYVLPVDSIGWVMEAGERIAVLRERRTGALIRVREGDHLAALGLTVLMVRAEGVIVRNRFGVNCRPKRVVVSPRDRDGFAKQIQEFNTHG